MLRIIPDRSCHGSEVPPVIAFRFVKRSDDDTIGELAPRQGLLGFDAVADRDELDKDLAHTWYVFDAL